MHIQRLTILADALETRIPKHKFNLTSWRNDDHAAKNGLDDESLLHVCGTTACAVGWACALPEFKAEGLRFLEAKRLPMWDHVVADDLDSSADWARSWASVEQFFGLDEETTEWLFMDDEYRDEEDHALPGLPANKHGYPIVRPEHVADRIRHLLAGDPMSSHSFEGFAA